jgi:hypothetical protein
MFAQPAPFPDKPILYYARAEDGSVHALAAAPEGWIAGNALEFGGRLYWTVRNHRPENDGSFLATLMCAKLDGSDSREVLSEWDKHPLGNLAPYAYQGSLYCFLDKMTPSTEEEANRTPYLCRLHPERSDPVEVLHRLPDTSSSYQFDGGYLYFLVRGHNLWAMVPNRSYASVEDTLCRVPLK